MIAAEHGKTDVVTELLSEGADLDIQNRVSQWYHFPAQSPAMSGMQTLKLVVALPHLQLFCADASKAISSL